MFLYKSAVIKHGSHDQSSHNPKKGGGRVGGGGSGDHADTNPNPATEMNQAISEAKADIDNRITGAKSKLGRGQRSGAGSAVIDEHIKGTVDGLTRSKALVGKKGALTKLSSEMNRAKKDTDFNPRVSPQDKAYVLGYANAVISIAQMYSNLEDA